MSKLPSVLLVSLLLSATAVKADDKYPATDFQPKVLYQDLDYKHSDSGSGVSTSKRKISGKVSTADSNYPAANFQPEVLFEDTEYKHKKDKVKSYSSANSETATMSSASDNNSTEPQSSDEDSSLALGLGILAIAGFLFYRKSTSTDKPTNKKTRTKKTAVAKKSRQNKPVSTTNSDGSPASGVAKYLENKVGPEPSSVEKYLEENASIASGVAKYVAQKKVSARTRVATVTGVEKYLKNQG